METWFIYAVLASVLFSAAIILQKKMLQKQDHVFFSSYMQFIISIFALAAFIFTNGKLPSPAMAAASFIYTGVFFGLGTLFYFKGLKHAEAGVSSIISLLRLVFAMFGGILVFHEKMTALKVSGILLIVIGIISIFLKKGLIKKNAGIRALMLSSVFFGIGMLGDKFFVQRMDRMAYMVMAFFAPALFILILNPKITANFKRIRFFSGDNTAILFTAIVTFSSIFFLISSYANGGDVSGTIPIYQTSAVLVVVLSAIFLDEKDNLLRKVMGAAIAVAGVILLGM
ncbi:MAG: DMT family transporter [Nanoarchaeota archaeon]|nr:DMT family transporter [Nanoarchaeota archaeon]